MRRAIWSSSRINSKIRGGGRNGRQGPTSAILAVDHDAGGRANGLSRPRLWRLRRRHTSELHLFRRECQPADHNARRCYGEHGRGLQRRDLRPARRQHLRRWRVNYSPLTAATTALYIASNGDVPLGNPGSVTVDTNGTLTGGLYGILAFNSGCGALSVTANGDVTGTNLSWRGTLAVPTSA
jgi:hypothetical protein